MLKRFKISVIVHLIAIVLTLLALSYYYPQPDTIPLVVVLSLIFVVLVLSLFRVANRTNRKLAGFLMGIKYDDFGTVYAQSLPEQSERELHGAFNLINGKLRDMRLEKEIQFEYFQTLVEQVQSGLIGFDDQGHTIFMNQALKELLHKSHFPTFQSIAKFDPELHQVLIRMGPGDRELLKRRYSSETIQLSIQKTILVVRGLRYEFYGFQNIFAELEEQETKSWQKLIRILTHEIMNSISPVVSLANTTNALMTNHHHLDAEMHSEVHKAIDAIEKRSESLLNFTSTYRQLTRLPEPNLRPVDLCALVDRILVLLRPTLKGEAIGIEKHYSHEQIEIQADPDLLEQAIINMLKNAIDALEAAQYKLISLAIEQKEGEVLIRIRDTGPGIPADLVEQIFVPFFTTRQEGSGIGLSLTRQIIQKHGGTISVYSREGKGVEFSIQL